MQSSTTIQYLVYYYALELEILLKSMASVCISNCVNNKTIPIRPTFANLYKWPESEVEFVKTINSDKYRVKDEVDSLSCRQMYLRSYKFSRKKSVTWKTIKCFSSIKESVVCGSNNRLKNNIKIIERVKYVTRVAVSIIHRLLSRSDKVHVGCHDF